METINRAVKEYGMRFNVTEQVYGNKGFLGFEEFKSVFKEEIGIIMSEPERGLSIVKMKDGALFVFNRNGMVKDPDGWLLADLKEKPKNWVVGKVESNPLWGKFKEWYNSVQFEGYQKDIQFDFEHYFYGIVNGIPDSSYDMFNFEGCQLLTLDQWDKFIYSDKKIDFSIIDDNPDEWFYIRMKKSNYGVLIKKVSHCGAYVYSGINYRTKNKVLQKINRLFSKENVDEFRFALKEEVKIVKEEFPEYFEPTEGDYCIFFESDNDNYTIRKLKLIRTYTDGSKSYIDSNNVAYSNCKALPKELHNSIIELLVDKSL